MAKNTRGTAQICLLASHSLCAILLLSAAPAVPAPVASDSILPGAYLQSRTKPQFRENHTLLPLSLAPGYESSMPFEVRRELADNWGWGLFFGRLTTENVEKARTDPASVYYKVLQLAKSNPQRYPLDVFLNTQNYFSSGNRAVSREKTPEVYLRDTLGTFIGVTPSPQIPDSIWDKVVDDLTKPLRQLAAEGVEFNVIQHWSEWFIPVWGFGAESLIKDPRVVAAMNAIDTTELKDHPHYDKPNLYLHKRRAHYEGRLADSVKAIAPNRKSYSYYGLSGGSDYGRYGGYDDWHSFQYGVGGAETINDYPGASLYRPDNGSMLNGGTTDNNVRDLLTGAVATKGVEIAYGHPLNQVWVWVRQDNFAEFNRYIGFLKSLYVLGQVGFINFLVPETIDGKSPYDYAIPFTKANPPTWLRQVEAFSHVHAAFTHLDDFIREGTLVEGPFRHIHWAQHLYWPGHQPYPGYVLDNPHEIMRNAGGGFGDPGAGKVRVVARQKKDGELLVCAWAADDTVRSIPVKLPNGQEATLEATPRGSLYRGYGAKLTRIDSGSGIISLRQGTGSARNSAQVSPSIHYRSSHIAVDVQAPSGSAVTVSLYSMRGERIWTESSRSGMGTCRHSISTAGLANGTFLVRIEAADLLGTTHITILR